MKMADGVQWMCCICIRMHYLRKERMIQILPAAHPPIAHPPAALQPSLHLMIQRRMTSQSRQPNQRTAGKVTEASAEVTGTKAEISADMVSRIVEAAGTDHVAITANVTDKEGNIRYTVTADAKDLTAGKKLSVVVVDKKTGAYKLVNAKTYTVGKDGTLHVNLAAGSDYRMLSAAEIKNVEKAVLKTVAVKKTTASIKAGKNTKIQLSSKLDLDNVKKITYTSGKKSVAAVDKNGKITAKKKGTVTIKAKVTLKNGKTKTVSMKIKVK